MRLLDAHRRDKARKEAAAQQIETEEERRRERNAVAGLIALALDGGYVNSLNGQPIKVTHLPDPARGPLGGESDRLYVHVGSNTFIVNVYAYGVMAPVPE